MTLVDFFYAVLATAIIILTVFITIALYHFVIILRRIHDVIDIIEQRCDKFFHMFHDLSSKIIGLKTTFDMFIQTVKTIVTAVHDRPIRKQRQKPKEQSEQSDIE